MRLINVENNVVVNAIMSNELLDGFIESDTANIGDSYSGGVFTAPVVAPIISTHPDGGGFTQAIKDGLGGIVGANALAVAYPLFFVAVQSGEWADVQALIVDATTKNLLTTQQYADIKKAAATFNIPITLE